MVAVIPTFNAQFWNHKNSIHYFVTKRIKISRLQTLNLNTLFIPAIYILALLRIKRLLRCCLLA